MLVSFRLDLRYSRSAPFLSPMRTRRPQFGGAVQKAWSMPPIAWRATSFLVWRFVFPPQLPTDSALSGAHGGRCPRVFPRLIALKKLASRDRGTSVCDAELQSILQSAETSPCSRFHEFGRSNVLRLSPQQRQADIPCSVHQVRSESHRQWLIL